MICPAEGMNLAQGVQNIGLGFPVRDPSPNFLWAAGVSKSCTCDVTVACRFAIADVRVRFPLGARKNPRGVREAHNPAKVED